MWRVTIKGILAHKFRMVLTSVAVILGVTFMAGTFVITDTIGGVFDDLFADAYKDVAVAVRTRAHIDSAQGGFVPGGGRQPVSESLVGTVEGVPGVEAAAGEFENQYAQFVDRKNKPIKHGPNPNFGSNWIPIPRLNSVFEFQRGRGPTKDDEVAMDYTTAKDAHFGVGDRVDVIYLTAPRKTYTISGTFKFGSSNNLAGATFGLFTTAEAQRVFNRAGAFDQILVLGKQGVSPDVVRDRIQQVLPGGVEAITGKTLSKESANAIKKNLSYFNTFLLIFAIVAVFVGAFIIYNTFSIIVAQRSRELALLRALGATGAQVTRSVAFEAVLVGIFSSVVGIGLGVLVALFLQWLLPVLNVPLPSGPTVILPRTITVSLLVGTVVTFVSAITPARRAARVPPIAAMRPVVASASSGRRRFIFGILVTLAGLGLLAQGLFGHVKSAQFPGGAAGVVGVAALLVFIGVAMLSPLAARPVAGALGWVPKKLEGISGQLARENAIRNPRRTASTAAALMIGLALMSLVTIFGSSAKASLNNALNETIRSDFFLTSEQQFIGFSPNVAKELAQHPATADLAEFRVGIWRYGQEAKTLVAASPNHLEDNINLKMTSGSVDALADGGMLIFEDVADEHGWKVGDTIPMGFGKNGFLPVQVPIDGVYSENRSVGSNYLLSLKDYERSYTDQVDVFIGLRVPQGFTAKETRAEIKRIIKPYPNVKVQDQAQYKGEQEKIFNTFLNFMLVLLAFSVGIAILGIINTLALSVFERTQELGLLRAVGMTREQTRVMVRWEAAIVSVFGAILGLIIGVLFGRALVAALESQGAAFALPGSSLLAIVVAGLIAVIFVRRTFWRGVLFSVPLIAVYFLFGRDLDVHVPGGQLLVLAILAGIAGLVAAAWPSARAVKLDVLDAVTSE